MPPSRKAPGKKAAKKAGKKAAKKAGKKAVKKAAKKAARRKTVAAKSAPAQPLEIGAPAPDVALWDHDGKPLRLADLRGRHVVLYFYPKDMTSGCTTQACEFQELLPAFDRSKARIVGVSPDGAASHRKFQAKHGLGFPLATPDDDKGALLAFGVWKEKSMYGRRYMGVERTTVLIDPEGRIARVWRKVRPAGHAAEVLAAIEG